MSPDFITWFLGEHYVVSTLMAPMFSIAYGIFTEDGVRVLWSTLTFASYIILKGAMK
jgi:hypothetical protein